MSEKAGKVARKDEVIHSGVREAGRDHPVPQRGDLRILTWNADVLNDQG